MQGTPCLPDLSSTKLVGVWVLIGLGLGTGERGEWNQSGKSKEERDSPSNSVASSTLFPVSAPFSPITKPTANRHFVCSFNIGQS